MSLKDSIKKQNQNNWTNLPKNAKKQFNFNRNHQNNSFKTMNYIDPQYNNSKILQKKRPPHLLHDSRSSSTVNFFPNGKVKNSLAFYPLDIRIFGKKLTVDDDLESCNKCGGRFFCNILLLLY